MPFKKNTVERAKAAAIRAALGKQTEPLHQLATSIPVKENDANIDRGTLNEASGHLLALIAALDKTLK